MVNWLVVALFLTSFLVADDVVSGIKVFCRKKDGSHIPVESATYRRLTIAKRDVPNPAPPPPIFIEFVVPCNENLRKECPGVDSMCTAWKTNTVPAHFKFIGADPILSGGFCSLVAFDEMKCAATQAELGVQPMTEKELCKGVLTECPIVTPPPTPAPTPLTPLPPLPEADWDEQTIEKLKKHTGCIPTAHFVAPEPGHKCWVIDEKCYESLRIGCPDCEVQMKTLSGGKTMCVAHRPRPQCNLFHPGAGETCEQIVNITAECAAFCFKAFPPKCVVETEKTDEGKILCVVESFSSRNIDSHGAHQTKLSDYIKSKSYPTIAPLIYHPGEKAYQFKQVVMVLPLAARITEVSEKDQAIGVMMMAYIAWTDHRLAWNESDFGGIDSINVARDSIWRPPIIPLNLMSFSNDDALKPNVMVQNNGMVSDFTIWNFRIAVSMQFKNFPFDSQTFYISLKSFSAFKLKGTRYIASSTESESEWRIMEDFEKVPTEPDELTYRVVIKRYPYFWIKLIILPCFILGFLVIAALTGAADSNSIEALVNIGLAASVASAVVVSTMTDHFPKTENVPSLATFVQSQFIIVVTVLITLSIRKALKPKIMATLHERQKTDSNELPMKTKLFVMAVKIAIHRLFAFIVFGSAYSGCFAFMMRHLDLNFERKQQEDWLFTGSNLTKNFLSPHNGQ